MSKLGRKLIRSLASLQESKSTWDLYKNEPFFKRVSKVLYTADVLDPVFDVYYAIRGFISNCRRLIGYAPLVWRHRNWDYGFILRFNKKLHEDLYKGCYVDGHHIFSKKDTRRLQTIINLYARLEEEDYSKGHSEYLDKKYGESDMYFPKVLDEKTGRTYTTMKNHREDGMSAEQLKVYTAERKRMWQHEENQRKQDLDLLGKYIAKYSGKFWD